MGTSGGRFCVHESDVTGETIDRIDHDSTRSRISNKEKLTGWFYADPNRTTSCGAVRKVKQNAVVLHVKDRHIVARLIGSVYKATIWCCCDKRVEHSMATVLICVRLPLAAILNTFNTDVLSVAYTKRPNGSTATPRATASVDCPSRVTAPVVGLTTKAETFPAVEFAM